MGSNVKFGPYTQTPWNDQSGEINNSSPHSGTVQTPAMLVPWSD
jgi:hypothetical protein